MGILWKFNSEGVRALLRDPSVTKLAERAAAISKAAGPEGDEGFVTHLTIGANRARAEVVALGPEAQYMEASDRALTRAIDAGRNA